MTFSFVLTPPGAARPSLIQAHTVRDETFQRSAHSATVRGGRSFSSTWAIVIVIDSPSAQTDAEPASGFSVGDRPCAHDDAPLSGVYNSHIAFSANKLA